MLYAIFSLDKPGAAALGGATLSDDGAAKTGSLLVLNVASRAEIDAFVADEPFTKAGLFSAQTVTRMRKGQWNPAAAPRTPEGD